MEVGKRIREARLSAGMTQQELGDAIGVQKSAIAKYENGRVVNIKRDTLQKMAKVLSVKVSDFIAEEEFSEEFGDIHKRLSNDMGAVEMLKTYYSLSDENQHIISVLIRNLVK